MSCPYFDFSDCQEEENEGRHKKLDGLMSAGCWSSAALKHLDYSNSVLQASFFTGFGWMKSPIKTMHSAFLYYGLNHVLMQVVL